MPNYRILHVEDRPIVREVTKKMLLGLGYETDSVPDGYAAVRRLEAGQYDVVMIDGEYPGMHELEQYLQAHPARIIGMPGNEDGVRYLGRVFGHDTIIVRKPASLTDFRKAFKQLG